MSTHSDSNSADSLPLVRLTDGRLELAAGRIGVQRYEHGGASYIGLPEDLIAAGVLRADMIPTPSKQVISHWNSRYPDNDRWRTRRRGGGRIQVKWCKDPLSLDAMPKPPAPKPPKRPVNQATVKALTDLLARANEGHVIGIAYLVMETNCYYTDVNGDIENNPVWAVGALHSLKKKLRKAAKRKGM